MTKLQCRVGVLSYGCGNIRSVINALEILGVSAMPVTNVGDIKLFNKLILPGVGSFGFAAGRLRTSGLADALLMWCENPLNKLLGICVGMQLLCVSSEESDPSEGLGLGLIEVDVKRLVSKTYRRLPNVGWAEVEFNKPDFRDLSGDYYFVHSYALPCFNDEYELAHSFYGDTRFVSGVTNCENVFGFQFHLEKSHNRGIALLKRFCDL
jgi:imidazole glycerol phosphate synthase glutamine amidotransferase subunit